MSFPLGPCQYPKAWSQNYIPSTEEWMFWFSNKLDASSYNDLQSALKDYVNTLIVLSTKDQATAGTDNTTIMTPLRVAQAVTGRIATSDQAAAGTDDTTIMTPLKVAQAIAAIKSKQAKFLYASDFDVGSGGDDAVRLAVAFAAANALGVELWFTGITVTLSADYTAPDGACMHVTRDVVFAGAAILNVKATWEKYSTGALGSDYTQAVPEIGTLHTKGDTYGIKAWQGQWSVSSEYWQFSDYEWAFYKEWPQNSTASPNGWPQATVGAFSVTLSGNLDYPAAMHAVSICGASGGSAWGHNIVVGTGKTSSTTLVDSVRFLCGLEVDIQPSTDTEVEDGAGILINNFFSKLSFAALSVVSDGGGWETGLYVGGLQSGGTLLAAASGTTALTGIEFSNATFSGSALALGANNNIMFKDGTGGVAGTLYADSGGTIYLQKTAQEFNIHDTTTTENVKSFAVSNQTNGDIFSVYTAYGASGATSDACLVLRGNKTTSRSINAGGTINASGADYAEYEWKAAGCGTIDAGDIAGFDKDGKLTQAFADAISFCVKSTSPNLVGGDNWHASLGVRPAQPSPPVPAEWAGGTRPEINRRNGGTIAADQAAWDASRAAWQAANATAMSAYKSGALAQWQAEMAAYNAKLEALRAQVDRIAYCGKVPVNVTGASVGDFIIATASGTGITGVAKSYASSTQEERDLFCVGRVRAILPDGRAEIVVKPV